MWLRTVGFMLLCLCIASSDCFFCLGLMNNVYDLKNQLRRNTEILENHDKRTSFDPRVCVLNELTPYIKNSTIDYTENKRTTSTVNNLENRLQEWLTDFEKKVSSNVQRLLNDVEARLSGQTARIEFGINNMATKLENKMTKQADQTQTVVFSKDIEDRLSKIESALEVIKESLDKNQRNTIPTLNVNLAIEKQTTMLEKMKKLLEDTSERICELPKVSDVRKLHNETKMSLQETNNTLKDVIQRGIDEIGNRVSESKEEVKNSVSALRLDLANNAERVKKDLHNLEKGQSVMVSMADHVLYTRDKVEHGVQDIVSKVGDLVKAQGICLNNTLTQRFDGILNDIIKNQKGALVNLTAKIEQEAEKVRHNLCEVAGN